MKKVFLALSLVLAARARLPAQDAQGGGNIYRISGQLKNMQAARVYLISCEDGEILDSAIVSNGRYVLTGKMTREGEPARLQSVSPSGLFGNEVPPGNIVGIFLTPESFSVTHIDSFSNTIITGSAVNADYRQLMQDLKPYEERERLLARSYQEAWQAKDVQTNTAIDTKLKVVVKGLDDTVYAPYVRHHPRSPLVFYVLQLYYQQVRHVSEALSLQTLFDELDPAVRASASGKTFAKRLAIAVKTSIGSTAMDFMQNDTLGKPIRLSAFRGRYVLLDFWASWCHPCREENPNLVSAYTQYHPKGFEILGVSLNSASEKDKWLKAIHEDGLAWTNVMDFHALNYRDNAAAVEYGVYAVPTNFLIDPQGKIVAVGLHGEELERKLGEIYKN